MNTVVPAIVAERSRAAASWSSPPEMSIRFARPRPADRVETDPPAPVGEYAQSCLGRERVFEYYSPITTACAACCSA